MNVICPACGDSNEFAQPHPYHAGFANQGFLYNDAGTLTLVWSSFDPAYEELVGQFHPWALTPAQRAVIEAALSSAPSGGNWSFANVPRCNSCHAPIGESITSSIYYLLYPDSLQPEAAGEPGRFRSALHTGA